MDCAQARELLHGSLDGLPAGSALREHLAACPGCRTQLADLRHTTRLLDTLQPIAAPAGLLTDVMAKIHDEHLARATGPTWRRAATAIAAMAALLGTLLVGHAAPWVGTTDAAEVTAPAAEQDIGLIMTETGLAAGNPTEGTEALSTDPLSLAQDLPAIAEGAGALLLGLCCLFISGTATLIQLLAPDRRTMTVGPSGSGRW